MFQTWFVAAEFCRQAPAAPWASTHGVILILPNWRAPIAAKDCFHISRRVNELPDLLARAASGSSLAPEAATLAA
jgi:hypothetical protein